MRRSVRYKQYEYLCVYKLNHPCTDFVPLFSITTSLSYSVFQLRGENGSMRMCYIEINKVIISTMP